MKISTCILVQLTHHRHKSIHRMRRTHPVCCGNRYIAVLGQVTFQEEEHHWQWQG